MYDLHSHVLPGIDDGPADLAGSIAMARVAHRSGTRVLAATPHVRDDHPGVVADEIPGRVRALNDELALAGVDLRIVQGGEVALLDALERDVEELRCVTLDGNGRDLLLETPWGGLTSNFEQLLRDVRSRGFRVLLAHPEMNGDFQREPDRLGGLVAEGVLVQVTASSFLGGSSSRRAGVAMHALRRGWVHVVASDGHRADWRPPSLAEGLAAVLRDAPEAAAEVAWMVGEAPRAILEGRDLPARPRTSWRRRRGRGRLLGR